MKYLERARSDLHKILSDFIVNELEDTEEYAYILEIYNKLSFHISREKLK